MTTDNDTMDTDDKIQDITRMWVKSMLENEIYEPEDILRALSEGSPFLEMCFEHDSTRSAEELEQIADQFSGRFDCGELLHLVQEHLPEADPLLLAAVARFQWRQDPFFDPEDLCERVRTCLGEDARRILTGDDRAFFDALPDSVNLYRGCSSIALGRGAAFVDWSTSFGVAEEHALQVVAQKGGDSIVLWATVAKSGVRSVFVKDWTVLAEPTSACVIDCRRKLSMTHYS